MGGGGEDYPSLGKGRAGPAGGVWGPSGPSSTPPDFSASPGKGEGKDVGKDPGKDMGKGGGGKDWGKDFGKDMGKGGGKDWGKDPGKDTGKGGGKDWGKDFGKDMGKGGGKDWGKDPGKDTGKGKDWGKDPGKDMGKGKDWGKDPGKDTGKGKDWGKDPGKDTGKGKDWGKDPGKDTGKGKDWGKDAGKDTGKGKDWGKDPGKDTGKGGGKDWGKDPGKDTSKGKDWGKDGGKEGKGYGEAEAPTSAPPDLPQAASAPPTAPPTAPPSQAASSSAPQRFGADDFEAAELADLEGEKRIVQEEIEDTQSLEIPKLSLGTKGTPLRLVSNHFTITVQRDAKSVDFTTWKCWRVDFARAESMKPKEGGLMKGRAPKSKGDDEREVSKAIRKQAVEQLLQDVPTSDWLHDGNNLLYTRKTVTTLSDTRTEVEVPGKQGKRPFQVAMELKSEGREIDLSWLQTPPDHFKDASEAMVAMSEHRRFVQVAIRTLALEREELISQSRKVVCPDNRLICDAIPLMFAREMWFGYIGQVEVVNGGVVGRDGKLAPARTALSLNLVASVGIPEMPFTTLLGKLCVRSPGNKRDEDWYAGDVCRNYWQRDYNRMRDALRTDVGVRRLKVKVEYGGKVFTGKKVVGITDKPAYRQEFDCEEMGGKADVVSYFKHKHGIEVRYPELPCLQLGNPGNCVPLEFVTVMGGEHNLEVGKLRTEFQVEVTRKTAMPPSQRRDQIEQALRNNTLGPAAALAGKGIKVDTQMATVSGRLLPTPLLKDGNSSGVRVNYSNSFAAVSPPNYEVSWGLWCFSQKLQESDVNWLAGQFVQKCNTKRIKFSQPKVVEWPQESFGAYYEGVRRRESFYPKLREKLTSDLQNLQKFRDFKLLMVLIDDNEAMTSYLYNLIKLITETEIGTFVTQFINCKKGIADADKKLNNIMLKVTPKVPLSPTSIRAAHNVTLAAPHQLLSQSEGTMIMGADVCHKVAGISVAAVLGSTDFSYASYFHEIRGQSPYTLNTLKVRSRQSEERIVDLSSMTVRILERWKRVHNALPKTIIYYRDGVSDGQFVNVLTRELNLLEHGFKQMSATYNPQLVIIVGQKRHQTRLWMEQGAEKGGGKGKDDKGKGKDDKGKGKGKGKDPAQVPPGTVASDAIAQPSHMNFFLVSQQGIEGTSVPCHYHVLHLDKRLIKRGIGVDDLENITFQLCHMYSRADKSVGYATPAYMADHACERGRCYLEAVYGASDIQSTMGSSSSEERKEEDMRKQIEERTTWLNNVVMRSGTLKVNGLQSYC